MNTKNNDLRSKQQAEKVVQLEGLAAGLRTELGRVNESLQKCQSDLVTSRSEAADLRRRLKESNDNITSLSNSLVEASYVLAYLTRIIEAQIAIKHGVEPIAATEYRNGKSIAIDNDNEDLRFLRHIYSLASSVTQYRSGSNA